LLAKSDTYQHLLILAIFKSYLSTRFFSSNPHLKNGNFFGFRWIKIPLKQNPLKQFRESLMLSKAELTRNAGVSPITTARIELGKACRLETQRKVLKALGLTPSDKSKLFKD